MHLHSTLLEGGFVLLGSVIGGVASYVGSKSAAAASIKAQQINIDAQNEMLEKEKARAATKSKEDRINQLRTSAGIIYIDLFAAIYEVCRYRNTQNPKPNYVPLSMNYSKHIERISTHLDFKQLVLLNGLYGAIEQHRNNAFRFSEANKNFAEYGESGAVISKELFGNNDNFTALLQRIDLENLNQDIVIAGMVGKYQLLFGKLRELIGLPVSGEQQS